MKIIWLPILRNSDQEDRTDCLPHWKHHTILIQTIKYGNLADDQKN